MFRRACLLLLLSTSLFACDKLKPSPTDAPASASVTSANAAPCAKFVDKMASVEPSKPGDREAFGIMCNAVSPAARACVEGASGKDAMTKCLEPEKEKITGAMLAAMMDQDKKQKTAEASKPPAPVTVAKFGLQLDVPGSAKVANSLAGGQSVEGWFGSIELSEASPFTPKNLKGAESRAKTTMKAQNLRSGTIDGGYWLTYEGDLGGKVYRAHVYRKIGKKAYECEGMLNKPEQAEAVLAACKTLRKN